MPNSNLTYKGQVAVKIKGKTRYTGKNTGTQHLFEALYSILTQKIISTHQKDLVDVLPGYITIVDYVIKPSSNLLYDSNIWSKSILLNEMPIITKNYDNTGLKYTCLLNNSNIKTSTAQNPLILLLNGAKTKVLAYLKFEINSIDLIRQDPQGQAELTWSMTFDNIPDTEK